MAPLLSGPRDISARGRKSDSDFACPDADDDSKPPAPDDVPHFTEPGILPYRVRRHLLRLLIHCLQFRLHSYSCRPKPQAKKHPRFAPLSASALHSASWLRKSLRPPPSVDILAVHPSILALPAAVAILQRYGPPEGVCQPQRLHSTPSAADLQTSNIVSPRNEIRQLVGNPRIQTVLARERYSSVLATFDYSRYLEKNFFFFSLFYFQC